MLFRKLDPRRAQFIIQNEFAKHGHSTDKANKAAFDAHLNPHIANLAAFRGLKIFREKGSHHG